jgi:hypothetical protein
MGMIFPLLALSILVIGALGVTWLITQGRPPVVLPRGGEDMDRLREAVQDLQLEMDAVRGELAEVQERLDFTERLLARGTDLHPPNALTSDGAESPPSTE